MRLILVTLIAASCSFAQMFPFPGPGIPVASGGAAPAFVPPAISAYSTTPATTAGFTTTAGASLVVTVGYSGVCGTSTWTVAGKIGGSASGDTFILTSDGKKGGTYSCSAIFVAHGLHAATGNYTLTAATDGGESQFGISGLQFTGFTATDQTGDAYGLTTTMTPSSALTPTGSPAVIVAGGNEYTSTYTASTTGSYILPSGATASSSGNGKITSVYRIANPASGSYSPPIVWSANDACALSAVTLK